MKKKYFVLGIGYDPRDENLSHPFEVWLDVQNEKFPLVLMEGKGMSGLGGNFKPSEILQKEWREHLVLTNTIWLLSLCEDAMRNEDVLDIDSVLEMYNHVNKKMPPAREIDVPD